MQSWAVFIALCTALQVRALDNGVGLVPAAGWSSYNVFANGVTASHVMAMADAMVERGLDKLGYIYVAIDCGWNLHTRDANGDLQPDPAKFPEGIEAVAKYVKGLGDGLLKLGIYTEHDAGDCCGGPGMKGHEDQDAAFYKANGIEYLKVDSCAGHKLSPRQMYENYANVRDALNRTGSPVYLNICPTLDVAKVPGLHPGCRAFADQVYTSRGFAELGLDVRNLANSALVEYCNNANNWDVVMTLVDAQATLADDSWSAPGSWIDADMLTVGCNDNPIPGTPCSHGSPLTLVEEYSQFSLWCIFTSNLMLGSDLRNASRATLDIISNREALAVNRDPLGAHGRLVLQGGSEPQQMVCGTGGTAAYDMHRANMTIAQAHDWCLGAARCAGFCAEAPDVCGGSGEVYDMHFMDSWAISRTGNNGSWSHWKAPPPSPPDWQVFAKPLTPAGAVDGRAGVSQGARRRAVALLNRSPSTANVTFAWPTITIEGAKWSQHAHVRDLWAHDDLGIFKDGFTAQNLPSHATRLLIVTEVL